MAALDGNGDGYILVIDDDVQVSQIIQLILEDEGWETEAAEDGEQAIALATRREPVMVVLDMNLPRMHGEVVAHHLHALYDDLAILVVTANDTARESAVRSRAVGFLRKPFEIEALVASVRRTLTGSGTVGFVPHS